MANNNINHFRSDILQKANDLYVNPLTNDFDIGPSDTQHVNDILISAPGWWKQWLTLGVDIYSYLKAKGQVQELTQSVRLQVQSDGYKVDAKFTFNGSLQTITNNVNLI